MKYYLQIFCWLRGIWWTLKLGTWIEGIPVCGHKWVDQPPVKGQPKCVELPKCRTCGTIGFGWTKCARCGAATEQE